MAEEFHTGVCSGSWWNAVRGGFEGPPMSAAAAVSCSAAASDVGSFGWAALTEMTDGKARSGEESAAAASASGGSTLTFHGSPGVHASDPASGGGFLRMEQTSPVAGSGLATSPSMDWSQAFLSSNRRIEGGFQAMLHDHLSSRSCDLYQEPSMESDQAHKGMDNSANPFKDFNPEFVAHQAHLNSGGGPGGGANTGFRAAPFACSPTLFHDLLDQDMNPQTSAFDACSSTNFMSPASYRSSSGEPSRFPHFLKSSPLKQQQPSSTDHLHFSSDTQLWNASPPTHQFFTQQALIEEKPSRGTTPTRGNKPSSGGARNSSPASTAKKSATNEPAFKKPRIETPSPLPTFKVRKEKLGDRITALQQLVSPFGKTDTASVLHEAIDYIKFLHDQVGALSTPYLKNGPAMPHHQHQKPADKAKEGDGPRVLHEDLRSRGLCLVPISATFHVVNEPTTADFWTPTLGGTYR